MRPTNNFPSGSSLKRNPGKYRSQLRNLYRKEVNTVKYEKPEAILLVPAIEAIQGTTSKPVNIADSPSDHRPSPAAYEADE
jgi:hypothetical protein